jgi:hypothetical protein
LCIQHGQELPGCHPLAGFNGSLHQFAANPEAQSGLDPGTHLG